MTDTRVASVQFQHAPGDKAANFATVRRFTAEAAEAGVELVVFPEMCLTGYWHLRNQSQADLKAETRRMCTGTRWIRSRRPEL